MDPIKNPYHPGAGMYPPELAGRDAIIEKTKIALARMKEGRPVRSLILYGLRGVGKTVLLQHMEREAEAQTLLTVMLESPEDRSLPALLLPALRAVLLRLSREAAIKKVVHKACQALASFVKATKVKYGDLELNIEFDALPGLADSGDLELDLIDLLRCVGEAVAAKKTGLVIGIDELQYVSEKELAALLTALHRLNQKQLPVMMMGAGLPQLLGKLGRAKSYAERLFEFCELEPLNAAMSREALAVPAARVGVEFELSALAEIVRQTQGYPYFLQEWGKHVWREASRSPITRTDAEQAGMAAVAELDMSFFRVRFDRLTVAEKQYLRAMAELGPGPHRSSDVARVLDKKMSALAPVRAKLIEKGMIYSPAHGESAFTVPLFDEFMKRTMKFLEKSGG